MGFSCTIKQGKTDLTADGAVISAYLYGLAPSNSKETDAPYRCEDLRSVVSNCAYGHKLKDAAIDSFKKLQYMVRENLESLKQCHCETCTCEENVPAGWSKATCEAFLAINPESITYLSGGY